jgi:hypothetical protein
MANRDTPEHAEPQLPQLTEADLPDSRRNQAYPTLTAATQHGSTCHPRRTGTMPQRWPPCLDGRNATGLDWASHGQSRRAATAATRRAAARHGTPRQGRARQGLPRRPQRPSSDHGRARPTEPVQASTAATWLNVAPCPRRTQPVRNCRNSPAPCRAATHSSAPDLNCRNRAGGMYPRPQGVRRLPRRRSLPASGPTRLPSPAGPRRCRWRSRLCASG